MVEQVNLLEDPAPAVGGHGLVDDLDCVLHLGVDVDAGLHRGVRALAQHLARQPVQLLGAQYSQVDLDTPCLSAYLVQCHFNQGHLYERGLTWNVLEAREVELAVLFFFRLTFLAASRWASMASSLLNISRILDRQLQFTFTVEVQTVSTITFLLCSKIEFDADAARARSVL